MKLQIPLTIQNSSSVQDLIRFTSNTLTKIQTILNGNITFSDNILGKVDLINNCSVEKLTATFQTPTFMPVQHNLGSVPIGYIQIGANNPLLTLGDGNQTNTSSTIYLKAGSTGTVRFLVF